MKILSLFLSLLTPLIIFTIQFAKPVSAAHCPVLVIQSISGPSSMITGTSGSWTATVANTGGSITGAIVSFSISGPSGSAALGGGAWSIPNGSSVVATSTSWTAGAPGTYTLTVDAQSSGSISGHCTSPSTTSRTTTVVVSPAATPTPRPTATPVPTPPPYTTPGYPTPGYATPPYVTPPAATATPRPPGSPIRVDFPLIPGASPAPSPTATPSPTPVPVLPDLVASFTSSMPTAANLGTNYLFSSRVQNIGAGNAGNSVTGFRIETSTGTLLTSQSLFTNPIPPGGQVLQPSAWSWTVIAGSFRAIICADITFIVPESNAANNCQTVAFTIVGPTPTPLPTAAAAPWLKTTGGDVHTNQNITTPGGPTE